MEPDVLASISYHRRKELAETLLIVVPVFLAVGLAAYLILINLELDVLIAVAILAGIAVFIGSIYAATTRASFNRFVRPAPDGEWASLEDLRDALESVSIGAGIDAPELVVLDLPTVNSVAFIRKGMPVVGVTRETAARTFSRAEAEGMMAHEVAHIILGDALKPMDIGHMRSIDFLLLVLLGLVAAFGIFLGLREEPATATISVLVGYAFIIWAGTLLAFMLRRYDKARRHDDILADSIAIKITSDPGGLKDLVARLDAQMKAAIEIPPRSACAGHLFVYPRPGRGDAPFSDTRAAFTVLSVSSEDRNTRQERERETIRLRLENLEAIENGNWPAFPGGH
ncbi:MAG: M48 family metalloprotease [Actinobacteria bacterium]|nr:M48 family metalloprotease [Actinomycetota bacterium]MBU2685963.1 M48 family metalloprotease [Actinomycetota bacterium]